MPVELVGARKTEGTLIPVGWLEKEKTQSKKSENIRAASTTLSYMMDVLSECGSE